MNLRKMNEADLSREALKLLEDFPTLQHTNLINENGQSTGPLDRHLLLVLFRDPKAPIKQILDLAYSSVGSSLFELIKEAKTPEIAHGQSIANVAFAEALLMRCAQRGAKPHIWGQAADLLHNHVNAINDNPVLKKMLFDGACIWYNKTMDAKADGQFSAVYGHGLMTYNHDARGETAVTSAINMLSYAARNGNAPAMVALTDLLDTPGALLDIERPFVLSDILCGIKRVPQDTASIAEKLVQSGLVIEAPQGPKRPKNPIAARAESLVINASGAAYS